MSAVSPAGRPLRVLYCTDTYTPQVNGVSVVTALSVSGLRERGWEVAVAAPRYPDFPPRGVRHFVEPVGGADRVLAVPSMAFPPYKDIRLAAPAYGRIAKLVDDFQPDLVHCATEFMIGRLGQVAAQRRGIPIVTSYHTDFSRYTEAYGAPRLRPMVTRYIQRFHSRGLRTYTPSAASRADLLGFGVSEVEVWGRTVDTNVFNPKRRANVLRASLGLGNATMFLHVGRLAAEKGIGTILDAFARARRMLPAGATRLVIAGGGPEEMKLRESAPPDVTFLGVLDRTKSLPSLYASADAFVFSSVTETLGLVVLEAMASGLPVIATPAGGVAEHLHHDVNGLAFAAGDADQMSRAMVKLALNPGIRERLSAGARQTAEALDWPSELDRLDASYREVLARAPANDTPVASVQPHPAPLVAVA